MSRRKRSVKEASPFGGAGRAETLQRGSRCLNRDRFAILHLGGRGATVHRRKLTHTFLPPFSLNQPGRDVARRDDSCVRQSTREQ